MEIYHGNIVYSESRNVLAVHQSSYIAVEDGIVKGIYPVLPEKYAALPVTDFGDSVILPAFSDLHVHAPQYPQRGLGMDLLLSDWLNTYTFPQEARFADMDYPRLLRSIPEDHPGGIGGKILLHRHSGRYNCEIYERQTAVRTDCTVFARDENALYLTNRQKLSIAIQ